jgi:hypothetical protein
MKYFLFLTEFQIGAENFKIVHFAKKNDFLSE